MSTADLKRKRPAAIKEHTYKRVKRTPSKLPVLANDIYVTIKTPMSAYIRRANKLLEDTKMKQLVIHGVGKCITKAAQLAVALQQRSLNAYSLEMTTGTVDLVDDIVYDDQNLDIDQDVRQTSSIRIVVIRIAHVVKD